VSIIYHHWDQNWIINKNMASDDIRSHTGFTFLGQEIPACDRMSSLSNFLFMIQLSRSLGRRKNGWKYLRDARREFWTRRHRTSPCWWYGGVDHPSVLRSPMSSTFCNFSIVFSLFVFFLIVTRKYFLSSDSLLAKFDLRCIKRLLLQSSYAKSKKSSLKNMNVLKQCEI